MPRPFLNSGDYKSCAHSFFSRVTLFYVGGVRLRPAIHSVWNAQCDHATQPRPGLQLRTSRSVIRDRYRHSSALPRFRSSGGLAQPCSTAHRISHIEIRLEAVQSTHAHFTLTITRRRTHLASSLCSAASVAGTRHGLEPSSSASRVPGSRPPCGLRTSRAARQLCFCLGAGLRRMRPSDTAVPPFTDSPTLSV